MQTLITIILALLIAVPASGEVKKLVTYVDYTENYVTAGWDIRPDSENISYYKIKMFHFERQVEIARGKVDHPGHVVSLAFPYGGHYIVMVTSCRIEEENTLCVETCVDDVCMETWSRSDDAGVAIVDGEPMGWWIYKYISPPTGGGVE